MSFLPWLNFKTKHIMIEIELKFQIEKKGIRKIVESLKNLGYVLKIQRIYEKTVMYDNHQGIMQTTDGRIRLRVSGEKYELCYKKPITRDEIKMEIEYEVGVSDFDMTEKILEMMEFAPTTSYERYRTVLVSADGAVKITIDEYPFSSFIEIEGGKENIKEVALDLGFDLKDNLTDPCDTLFQRWRKERGLPFKPHMLFNDYNKK